MILTLNSRRFSFSVPAPDYSRAGVKFFKDFWNGVDSLTTMHKPNFCMTISKAAQTTWTHDDIGYPSVGFRPCMMFLSERDRWASTGIRDGEIIKMFTMLVDGNPVLVKDDSSDESIVSWLSLISGAGTIAFSDHYFGDEYIIPWYFFDNKAYSTVPLLADISWQQLAAQGLV